jgi:type II restriction enzyme
MESLVDAAIESTLQAKVAYCKSIVPNEVGATGSHQVGFYIAKNAYRILFPEAGVRGENKDKIVEIIWQDDFVTESKFIYYGKGTRNEYRITRFGIGFPFLKNDSIGDLFVLLKLDEESYKAYVLSTEEQIEAYLLAFELSPAGLNRLINIPSSESRNLLNANNTIEACYEDFIESLLVDFPPTKDVASQSRMCHNTAYNIGRVDVQKNPDKILVDWVLSEYELFKTLERSRYSKYLTNSFESIEDLVKVANTILNRRKSRAGASLEHHLEEVFSTCNLMFSPQPTTEGKKKPDFLFPGVEAYKNIHFNQDELTVLAVKTTCKDRWRQILNEANRIPVKHLFTLQQGISSNQLAEMTREQVQLVVPKQHIKTFPHEYRNDILDLKTFISKLSKSEYIAT